MGGIEDSQKVYNEYQQVLIDVYNNKTEDKEQIEENFSKVTAKLEHKIKATITMYHEKTCDLKKENILLEKDNKVPEDQAKQIQQLKEEEQKLNYE